MKFIHASGALLALILVAVPATANAWSYAGNDVGEFETGWWYQDTQGNYETGFWSQATYGDSSTYGPSGQVLLGTLTDTTNTSVRADCDHTWVMISVEDAVLVGGVYKREVLVNVWDIGVDRWTDCDIEEWDGSSWTLVDSHEVGAKID